MSLKKQMILFITTLLLVVLAGTFLLNVSNTKTFLEEQLASHAQDTATSLGLSLSTAADPDDTSTMETMINAVFDRGYYSHITLIDVEDKRLYERSNPQEIEGIPTWFIQMVSIDAPTSEALVQTGWIPIGSIYVQSHPGYAYIELWDTAIGLLKWFASAALISMLIAFFTLKAMLRPLQKMEEQAEAIVKKEYLLQENIPNTVEFRQVVSAMNAMVNKMKDVFDRDARLAEKLQKMAYQDSVTEMSNRLHFEMTVDPILDPLNQNQTGIFVLIRLDGLKELNDQFGYLVGDKMMRQLADSLRASFTEGSPLFARLNGTELIAILPNRTLDDAKTQTEQIATHFPEILEGLGAQEAQTFISVAAMNYQVGHKRGPLLAKMDYAIEQSKKQGKNKAFFYEIEVDNSDQDNTWIEIINSAIAENRFTLFQQSAFSSNDAVHDQELLIRMKDTDGTIRSAGYFMPAVAKLNKVVEIDQLVIKLALDYLNKSKPKNLLAVNLTKAVLDQQSMVDWLLNEIEGIPENCLAFEFPESLITSDRDTSWPLINRFKELNISVGIDHFGSSFTDMQYLQELRPDYIKLDAAFSKTIDKDDQIQSYVSSLCEMANSLDITVIAMAVENDTHLETFKSLGVSYFQGYHFGAPTPLEEK